MSPFAVLAYLSPLRYHSISTLKNRLEEQRHIDNTPDPSFPSFEFGYDFRRRQKIVKYGCLGA